MNNAKFRTPILLSLALLSPLWNGCSKTTVQGGGTLGVEDPNDPSATTANRVDETANSAGNDASPTGNDNNDASQSDQTSPGTDSNNTQQNNETTTQDSGSGETQSNTTDTSTTSTPEGETNAQGQILCGSKVWACGDGIDNDNDGKVDLDDPECISPCDNTEGTFATALPGQNSDCKADCYFDADSGSGNDKCDFNLKCDILAPAESLGCAHDSSLTSCEPSVPQTCLDVCVPLLPNGCDCFGCCEVKSTTGSKFIYLGSGDSCNLENLDECSSCTFNDQCSNSCDRDNCELCFGDEQLPAHCTESSCQPGISSCKTSSDCALGEYCLTGCCAFNPG